MIYEFWKLKITKEGIYTAGFMAIRLSFLIIGSSIMTLTTTPNNLTDGLEKGLGFLKIIHVPVHEISMMMSAKSCAQKSGSPQESRSPSANGAEMPSPML